MIRVERNLMLDLGLIHILKDGQAMSHTGDTHFFQFIMLQSNKRLANNFIFCYPEGKTMVSHTCMSCGSRDRRDLPRKISRYWRKLRDARKLAQSCAFHSVMAVSGRLVSSIMCWAKVGVSSAEGGSESIGEASESVFRWGEVYSSSASSW